MNLSRFLHLRLQGAAIDASVYNKKGGGGSPPANTTSQVTQSNIPDYAAPYFTRTLDRAEAESQLPYATYMGPRLQPLAANQNQAINQAGIFAQGLPGQIAAGSNYLQQAGIGGLNAAQGFNPQGVLPWMNPYQQGVIDINKREANRQFDIMDMQRRGDPRATSALGGYRDAIMTAENDRNRQIMLGDIQNQGMQSAYDRAVAAAQQQAQLGLGGYQQMGAAGQALVSAGGMQREMERAGLTDLERTGLLQQQQGQQALDLAYTDFRNAQDYPRQQLAFMSGILRGLPVTPNTEVTRFEAQPNPYSQLMGLGLGAAGISKMIA